MSKLQAALIAVSRGLHVFPCSPNTKIPLKGWTDWEGKATSDSAEVLRIWTKHPLANIGVATGPSNLVVIDFDSAKNPDELSGIEEFHLKYPGVKLPKTYTVHTWSGGWHLYYKAGDTNLRNSAKKLVPHVDSRANGGYVLGEGSVVNGCTYTATSDYILKDLPQWVADALQVTHRGERGDVEIKGSVTAYALAALKGECKKIRDTGEGGRNHAVNRAAWNVSRFVVNGELDESRAENAIVEAGIVSGLSESEASAAAWSGLTSGKEFYA